jgi:high-affinity iron transporter
MLPTFLITLREVIEASLIISIFIVLLIKFDQKENLRTVWLAIVSAIISSLVLVGIGSLIGIQVQDLYEEHEPLFEGILMIISVIFITWVIFYLHGFLSKNQKRLTEKASMKIQQREKEGIFVMVFTIVFREGVEIALFLSTFYLYSKPQDVLMGFIYGLAAGIFISFIFYKTTQRIPINNFTSVTNILLILFSAGLLIRAIHEFTEAKILPEIGNISLFFMPSASSVPGSIIKSLFGFTNEINLIQIIIYAIYIVFIVYLVKYDKPSN